MLVKISNFSASVFSESGEGSIFEKLESMRRANLRDAFKPKNLKNTAKFYGISFVFAFVFSLPIYVAWIFDFYQTPTPKILGSLLGIFALIAFLKVPKSMRFSFGFFVGLLWFYWVCFGFRFFGIAWALPLGIIGVGAIYGAIFWLGLICNCFIGRALFGLLLAFFAPFGFDWLRLEVLFSYSYFGAESLDLFFLMCGASVLAGLSFRSVFFSLRLVFGLLLCAFALNFGGFGGSFGDFSADSKNLPKIKLVTTNISQDEKWNPAFFSAHVSELLEEIDIAIRENYEIVLLPETAFVVSLEDSKFHSILLEKSQKIAIVTGSVRRDASGAFNSAYIYENGAYAIIDKQILVPFGEYFPLGLGWLKSALNMGSFERGSGERTALISGRIFTSAICYEATHELTFTQSQNAPIHAQSAQNPSLRADTRVSAWQSIALSEGDAPSKESANVSSAAYFADTPTATKSHLLDSATAKSHPLDSTAAKSHSLHLDSARLVLAMSNNGWFTPSIEPTLQKMLMKFFARKYNAIIFHSANASPSAIITP